MTTVKVAREAMATRFEMVACGADVPWLRAALEEALDEVDRTEARLSIFLATSDMARVNAAAGGEAVQVDPLTVAFLERARHLASETGGAFDLSVGPWMDYWGFRPGVRSKAESPGARHAVGEQVGMQWMEVDPVTRRIRLGRPGMRLDPGGMGKGWALDAAAAALREAGVTSALLHGGTSSVLAIGAPPGRSGWPVGIPSPEVGRTQVGLEHGTSFPPGSLLATIELRDEALSVSAAWGRTVVRDGVEVGHVLDPRTGDPARGAFMAAAVTPSAADADALTTALLVGGVELQERLHARWTALRSLLVVQGEEDRGWVSIARGLALGGN